MHLEKAALHLSTLCGANHKWNEIVPEFPSVGFTRAGIAYGCTNCLYTTLPLISTHTSAEDRGYVFGCPFVCLFGSPCPQY